MPIAVALPFFGGEVGKKNRYPCRKRLPQVKKGLLITTGRLCQSYYPRVSGADTSHEPVRTQQNRRGGNFGISCRLGVVSTGRWKSARSGVEQKKGGQGKRSIPCKCCRGILLRVSSRSNFFAPGDAPSAKFQGAGTFRNYPTGPGDGRGGLAHTAPWGL